MFHVEEALTDLIQQEMRIRWRDTTVYPFDICFNIQGRIIRKKAGSVYIARQDLAEKLLEEAFYRFGIYLEDEDNDGLDFRRFSYSLGVGIVWQISLGTKRLTLSISILGFKKNSLPPPILQTPFTYPTPFIKIQAVQGLYKKTYLLSESMHDELKKSSLMK